MARGNRVLILESDKSLRLSRARALSREGYRVTGVSSAGRAVKAASQQPYQLLVVNMAEPDLMDMPLAQFPPAMGALVIASRDTLGKAVENSGTGIRSFMLQPFGMSEFKRAVAQAIDQVRLVEEGLRGRVLTALELANRWLASETETDEFFRLVVEISAAESGADYVSLLVKEEARRELAVKAQTGEQKPAWDGICQRLSKRGKPVLLDEAKQSNSRLYRLMAEAGISAVLCMPLVAREGVIGTINHVKLTPGARFTSADLDFASVLGGRICAVMENIRLFGRCQRQQQHLERLLGEISHAQENERRRVASEIHDSVAQWMVGASYGIKACSTLISESRFDDLEFELTKIEKTLQRSIKELRRAIANLRPLPLEELGLVAALQQSTEVLVEEGIRCRTDLSGVLPKLTLADESATYWVVQEALTNIRKYARATDVSLHLQCRNGTVSVEVSDNGQGFNTDEVMNSEIPLEHMGLVGMRERAELLGGYLDINSRPGEGTSISFTFPVSS